MSPRHAVDTIDLTFGMACWRCHCGRDFWSRQGFDRHVAVSTCTLLRPWPGRLYRRAR